MWKDVVGYEGLYRVSDEGQVYSVKSDKMLKLKNDRGYNVVVLYMNNKPKGYGVHRLVATAFYGLPPAEDSQVNHINGIKNDNRVENLEWCSPWENTQHAIRTGLKPMSMSETMKETLSDKSKAWWDDEKKKRHSELVKAKWCNPEYRKNTIANMRGKTRTEEQKEHYRQALAKRENPSQNPEAAKKISEAMKKRTGELSCRSRRVLQIDPHTLEVVKVHVNARQAAADIGASINYISGICRAKGTVKTGYTKGFYWSYEDEYFEGKFKAI